MRESSPAMTVYDEVVRGGFCSGCGVCAGVCSGAAGAAALTMRWNESGAYEPVIDHDACRKCNLCLNVCPFVNGNPDTDVLGREIFAPKDQMTDSVLGKYLGLYAGYSTVHNHRAKGAAGGMATWFLESLLANGTADRVAHVIPDADPDRLFRFTLSSSREEIRKGAKSAYYPVELSAIVEEMLQTEGRYVIVGLPCAIRALRLAARKIPKLHRRLAMTIGLTCGQARSRFFAEYLCARCGGSPAAMDKAVFRVKDAGRHHLDHRFECSGSADGKRFTGAIYQTEGMGWLWGHDCFKIAACNYCDDITAELADISFADAIDEPYCYGNGGANFIIVRSSKARDMLEQGVQAGELELRPAPLEALRHRMEGVELIKRRDFRQRLYVARNSTGYVPVMRQSAEARDDEAENEWMDLRDRLRETSTATYAAHRRHPNVVEKVDAAIEHILKTRKGTL